jgi:hypothetical protein
MIEIEEEEQDQKIEEKETTDEKPYWYNIGLIFSITPILLWAMITILSIKLHY